LIPIQILAISVNPTNITRMKPRVHAKIGTMSLSRLILWNNKAFEVGDRIWAMEAATYDGICSTRKNIKRNGYWKDYRVDEIAETMLFLSN